VKGFFSSKTTTNHDIILYFQEGTRETGRIVFLTQFTGVLHSIGREREKNNYTAQVVIGPKGVFRSSVVLGEPNPAFWVYDPMQEQGIPVGQGYPVATTDTTWEPIPQSLQTSGSALCKSGNGSRALLISASRHRWTLFLVVVAACKLAKG